MINPPDEIMEHIGIIEFCGVDYGKITSNNQGSFKFQRDSVIGDIRQFAKGMFVSFELQGINGINVKLIQEVGVVKWVRINGQQIEYGVIELGCAQQKYIVNDDTAPTEIFFHTSQVISDQQALKQDVAVTFGVRRNYKIVDGIKKNKIEATQITLLSEEQNLELIQSCLTNPDKRINQPALDIYLDKGSDIELKINLVLERLSRLNNHQQKALIARLPVNLKLYPSILTFLPPVEQINTLENLLLISPESREQIVMRIATIIKTHQISAVNIPTQLRLEPSICSLIYPCVKADLRPDASEAAAIKNTVQMRGIKHLVHLTTL